jgi:hypothetical protein
MQGRNQLNLLDGGCIDAHSLPVMLSSDKRAYLYSTFEATARHLSFATAVAELHAPPPRPAGSSDGSRSSIKHQNA